MERKNIEEIEKLYAGRCPYDLGAESHIFVVDGKLFKNFNDNTPLDVLRRKEKLLLGLDSIPSLQEYYPKIYFLVNFLPKGLLEEYIKGYVMEPKFDKPINTVGGFSLKRKSLENLRRVLELFRNYGYLYLDIRKPNIRFDENGKPTLLDVDSVIQPDNPILYCTPVEVKKYIENNGKVDANMQTFIFNAYTQEALELNQWALDDEGFKLLKELKDSKYDSRADHEYLIDHLKGK